MTNPHDPLQKALLHGQIAPRYQHQPKPQNDPQARWLTIYLIAICAISTRS